MARMTVEESIRFERELIEEQINKIAYEYNLYEDEVIEIRNEISEIIENDFINKFVDERDFIDNYLDNDTTQEIADGIYNRYGLNFSKEDIREFFKKACSEATVVFGKINIFEVMIIVGKYMLKYTAFGPTTSLAIAGLLSILKHELKKQNRRR